MRQVLATGKKANHRPSKMCHVIAHRTSQHRISLFKCVEHRTLTHGSLYFEFHFAINASESAQIRRKHDTDHGNVCTSTESTAGRSRTMGFQLSPASGDV